MESYTVLTMNNTTFRPLGLYDYKAYIANESFARSLLINIRWPKRIFCPKCQSSKIWKIGNDLQCGKCQCHFSATSGTIFARTHLKISQWIIAVGLFKIGISAKGLQWAIGCNYITARRVLNVIREVVSHDPILQVLQGEIEVDETYYGGKRKGKRGRGAAGKTIVLGFKERKNCHNEFKTKTKTVVIPNVNDYTLLNAVAKHVRPGSTVYSDGFRGYNDLELFGYEHEPFDHSLHFVKTDKIHTQGIEGYWGVTKPLAKALYRKITKKNMLKICAENDFKFNHSKNPDFMRLVLNNLLKYHPLTI